MTSDSVKVVVGKDKAVKEFTLHEKGLTKHSEYAVTALNGKWRESHDRVIKLDDDDAAAFEIFTGFVYTGDVYVGDDGDKNASKNIAGKDSDNEAALAEQWTTLGKCYLLGDTLLSISFKSAVVDAMAKKLKKHPRYAPLDLWRVAYERTTGNNSFRRLMVVIACVAWESDDFKEVNDVEFLRDVARKFASLRGGNIEVGDLWGCSDCLFHDHGRGEACYLDMF